MLKKKFKVIKKEYSEPTTDTYITSDGDDEETYVDDYRYKSIASMNLSSTYKKPVSGSKQDNLTKQDILDKLDGYKALRTMKEKAHLLNLPPFKVWIRYFNTKTKEFRIGGLLKLVDSQLRYIMLVNTSNNLTWSVQLADNIIFIPKDTEQKLKENIQKEQEKEKETIIKDKLYKLYKQGKLSKK
jgi:hypothetical protein